MSMVLKLLSGLLIICTLSACDKGTLLSSVISSHSSGVGIIAVGETPAHSKKYTISSTLEILKPVNLKAMANDAQ